MNELLMFKYVYNVVNYRIFDMSKLEEWFNFTYHKGVVYFTLFDALDYINARKSVANSDELEKIKVFEDVINKCIVLMRAVKLDIPDSGRVNEWFEMCCIWSSSNAMVWDASEYVEARLKVCDDDEKLNLNNFKDVLEECTKILKTVTLVMP